MKKRSPLQKAILKTLVYAGVFEYPLTFYQLSIRLLSKIPFTAHALKKALEELLREKKIIQKGKVYYLPGIKVVNWKFRFDFSKKLLSDAKLFFRLLEKIPWIKFVGVTGSVAAYNSNPQSDIDIFVITEKNRLWLTRGLVATIIKILGKYPTHKKEKDGGKICPNLFIDTEAIEWPLSKRNLHIAHDIVLMQPLIDKESTYFKFLKANSWALNYFPNITVNLDEALKDKQTTKTKKSWLLNIIENFAQKSQIIYMGKKKSVETTLKHIAHFNKFDNTNRILTSYQKLLKEKKVY
jgi:hypothetical protein